LPGGAISDGFFDQVAARWPFLGAERALRMGHAYGSMIDQVLGEARSQADLGEDFGGGLTAREVDWLVGQEWAQTAEDVLWRRSKLGLVVGPADVARLVVYLAR
jgi:glycerol-3-phosphate dehydrogenase